MAENTITTFSPELSKLIAEFVKEEVRRIEKGRQTPSDRIPLQRHCLAQVLNSEEIDNAFRHSWREVRWDIDEEEFQTVFDRREGTTELNYLITLDGSRLLNDMIVEAFLGEDPTTGKNFWYASPYKPISVKVDTIENDYLNCLQFTRTGGNGAALKVAKPEKLRHSAGQYGLVSSLTTVNAQTVEVEGTVGPIAFEETWQVSNPYAQGNVIVAASVLWTGVEVNDAQLRFIDLNVDGRRWKKVLDFEGPTGPPECE